MKKKQKQYYDQAAFPIESNALNINDSIDGLTKMEYAMINGIASPQVPNEFYMAAFKQHPKWTEIVTNNPSVKAEMGIHDIFKNKYQMDYLTASMDAEIKWKMFYYERMFDVMEKWDQGENEILKQLFEKSTSKIISLKQ